MTSYEFARMCDATLTGATATYEQTKRMLDLAKIHHFYSIIGPRCYIDEMINGLANTDILVGAGCSNITGADPAAVKAHFAKWLVDRGVHEIENIMNISAFKSGLDDVVVNDVRAVREAIGEDIVYKCIIEVCYLTDDEIRHACELLIEGGVDFVKTSTGKAGPTTLHHLEVIADTCRDRVKIKASGGIRTVETVRLMQQIGVSRFGIGLDSAINIIDEFNKHFQ
jgi:deoxyribose-phosphate aldolase